MLGDKVQELVTEILYHDQVDFMPEMHGSLDICKSINVIHSITILKDKKHIIISVDVAKAFYKTQYPFMTEVLEKHKEHT